MKFMQLMNLVMFVVWQAAELLRHQHLQPYALKIHLKINSPRRNSLSSIHWPETDYIKKTRFAEPEDVPLTTYREKRLSYGNDRTLNPSISLPEQDSPFSDRRIQNTPRYLSQRMAELSVGSSHEGTVISKKITSKVARTPGFPPTKASATPKRRAELTKNHESVRSGEAIYT